MNPEVPHPTHPLADLGRRSGRATLIILVVVLVGLGCPAEQVLALMTVVLTPIPRTVR